MPFYVGLKAEADVIARQTIMPKQELTNQRIAILRSYNQKFDNPEFEQTFKKCVIDAIVRTRLESQEQKIRSEVLESEGMPSVPIIINSYDSKNKEMVIIPKTCLKHNKWTNFDIKPVDIINNGETKAYKEVRENKNSGLIREITNMFK
jgi:hypothetical protein